MFAITVFVGRESGHGLVGASDSGSLTRLQLGCQLGLQPSQSCLGNMGSKCPQVAVGSPWVLSGHWPETSSVPWLLIGGCPHGVAHNMARNMFSSGERVLERANKREVTIFLKPNLESDCSPLCHVLFTRRRH